MSTTDSTPAKGDPRARRPFPLVTGVARVAAVAQLTPTMLRITIVDEALRQAPVEQPGEIITLLWPEPGSELVLPEVGWRFPPGVADRRHARNYTVRRWEPGSDAMDIDFVVHGDHGRASRWAAAAVPGHELGYAAARMHWTGAGDEDWTLLVADETGLPALAAIAETLPAGHPAVALVEVDGAGHELVLDSPADVEVRWLHRGAAEPGTTTLVPEAVAALELPGGRGRIWGAAEAAAMVAVRRDVKSRPGGEDHEVAVLGYWKHRGTDDWD